MTQPEILDQEIGTLQERLRAAWQQLGDPSLTAFARRELRNQMKQYSAELRSHLQAASERRARPVDNSARAFSRPELRILA
jgi:hypothetical protein